ncbi:hypothetical protein ElyMa_002539400, partial [Elysia marginata]
MAPALIAWKLKAIGTLFAMKLKGMGLATKKLFTSAYYLGKKSSANAIKELTKRLQVQESVDYDTLETLLEAIKAESPEEFCDVICDFSDSDVFSSSTIMKLCFPCLLPWNWNR